MARLYEEVKDKNAKHDPRGESQEDRDKRIYQTNTAQATNHDQVRNAADILSKEYPKYASTAKDHETAAKDSRDFAKKYAPKSEGSEKDKKGGHGGANQYGPY